ncbi:hypothetical protein F444_00123 [Phytophthora nicotianae P1976]|uniref:ISXO2-like transposase domain-containing protein n=1 Tax=Phytophthora nicotianae P1976 TaxID=1317066 RepID=A0A081B5D7_PHYNI|nr:hypothetical protein F444_00123 [Phytophthora nicotianae P1976]
MASSTRPSSIAKTKVAASPCPMMPRSVDVQAARGLKDTTFDGLMDATSSASDALAWCMSVHLLPTSLLCPKCAKDMRLDVNNERRRCSRSLCRTERSVRTSSFFAKSKLPLRKLVRLICHWAARAAVTKAAEIVGVNEQAAMQWYTYCRDVCSKEMLSIPVQIGGEGHIVEIDETSLKKKSKYNRGKHFPDYWLFGGVDHTTNRWFGIVTYEDRTKPTLSAIMKKHIKPGTLVMSDQFTSETYVDPVSGAHTNGVEGAWEIRIKRHLKAMRGMKKSLLPMYLDEYLWRTWFAPPQATVTEVLRVIVRGIVKYYY